jgi:hypothetical protein
MNAYILNELTSFNIDEAASYRVAHTGVPIGGNIIPFRWGTHRGDTFQPFEMAAEHLYYAVRMLFNNTVPPVFRVGQSRPHREVRGWSAAYLYTAAFSLTSELISRIDELPAQLQDEFLDLAANALVLESLIQHGLVL